MIWKKNKIKHQDFKNKKSVIDVYNGMGAFEITPIPLILCYVIVGAHPMTFYFIFWLLQNVFSVNFLLRPLCVC